MICRAICTQDASDDEVRAQLSRVVFQEHSMKGLRSEEMKIE